ncbi:hypothetical protein N0B44_23235 [Roseibacterium beibuensis]|uniref:Major facilitator superfamily (MFS) profile domain-containing protein n=1 Tax=[Roseibacterium] beibuensis TaxID=1193142 RepID=A0ABP9LMX0_9RHOB|nr:hypothetical protein [Roseibacterium beibuensis]
MTIISKIFAALIFLVLTFFALSPLGAGIGEALGATIALGGAALVALIVLLAPTGRRAWGRGFLLDGAVFIAMPLLVIPLLGRAYGETVQGIAVEASSTDAAAASIGAGIGVAAAFGAFSFIGLILGLIFLVFGAVLVLGGRREVIVVQQPPSK